MPRYLTFGTAAAFLLERMENSITSPDIAQAVSGWPSLGVIPSLNRKIVKKGMLRLPGENGAEIPARNAKSLSSWWRPRSQVAEGFRSVLTSILLSWLDSPPKILLVTSALSQVKRLLAPTSPPPWPRVVVACCSSRPTCAVPASRRL
jgi:polysaccharide biosynthesis transport protein